MYLCDNFEGKKFNATNDVVPAPSADASDAIPDAERSNRTAEPARGAVETGVYW